MKMKALVLGLSVLTSFTVNAACKQIDAKGTWITYQSAFVTDDTNAPHVAQCQLVVDAKGNLNATTSNCDFVTFKSGKIPTGGTFKVNSDCSADINLVLGGFVGQVQIAKDKHTYTGRFETQEGAVSGITNAVKK